MKRANLLNDLGGSEWLYWTETLYLTSFPPDPTHRFRKAHGAIKPPELMAEIISFFTKKGELVLDPFAGVGGTLLGASLVGRRSLGFELNPKWVKIYRQLQRDFVFKDKDFFLKKEGTGNSIKAPLIQGDCLELIKEIETNSIDAIITDPPYGCQHKVSGFKEETNFNMFNQKEGLDFANAPDFDTFLDLIHVFGVEAWRVLKDKRYLVMIIGDRYIKGEYLPLGIMVANTLQKVGFKFKGLRIWANKATQRPLKPYAIYISFVPNITHQNILILRKEA